MPGLADFVTALGIAFVLEGVLYALFPGRARAVWEMVAGMPEQTLRIIGLAAAAAGLFLVWLVRG
ncbi:MAG: DUF2065 domain-containing protein [Rhizobiaceae bacterium]|jgi:hypothetical protein|nr:DUF2065 domain-containing protein [Rhizobiaceae bacterium]